MSRWVVGLGMLVMVTTTTEAQRSKKTTITLSPPEVTLYARLLQMADQRQMDDALVREGLASPNPFVRAEASAVLAQVAPMRRTEAMPLLRELVADQDTAVAANACFGLGLAHDTTAIPALSAAVSRAVPIGRAAAWSLGEIGSSSSSTLSTLLADRTLQPVTQVALLLAAARMKPVDVSAITPYLALKVKNPTVRWAAAYALARQRPPAGLRALLRMPRPNAEARAEIARALTRSAVGDSLRQDALHALAFLVLDDYPHVRINAIRSVATYGPIARVPITRALNDEDPNVRIAAAQSAGTVLSADSAEWMALWDNDTSFVYQRSILESSARAGATLPALRNWHKNRDWRYRAAVASAWQYSPDTADAKLNTFLAAHDPEGRVRAAAYEALIALDTAKQDTVIQKLLAEAVQDTDRFAREAIPTYKPSPTALDSLARKRPVSWYEHVVRDIVLTTVNGPGRGATFVTPRGTIRVAFLGVQAPLTVNNFIILARRGFYRNMYFHRVVPNFVAQDGDPRGDGNGGPGYSIRDELNRETYEPGMMGMALSGPDTGGSQYFFTLSAQPHLDGHYTIFGRVVTGGAVLDRLVQGDRILSLAVQ